MRRRRGFSAGVDDADVAKRDADQPGGDDHAHCGGQTAEIDIGVKYGADIQRRRGSGGLALDALQRLIEG